jgi:spore germination cell wall hydrolase CwlJ-like protein
MRVLPSWLLWTALLLAGAFALAGVGAWRAVAQHGLRPAVAGAAPVPALPVATRPAAVTPALAPVEIAAPAEGVTGTIALPPLPALAQVAPAETGIVAASAFSSARATALDRARALECLTAAIYYEAASEPDAGQRAVAQVVLNRVRHPAFPATVCGVVYQGSERAGCQFSFACDGAMARVPSAGGWARAARNAAAALAGAVYAPVGLATHYHTFAVTPAWNRSLVMTDVVGAHFFHRWKGWWGTAPAFSQPYRGGEPVPGPHPRQTPLIMAAAAPVPPAPAVAPPPTPQAQLARPELAESGTAVAPPPADDRLPPASQVLDRWKDSGKPLR